MKDYLIINDIEHWLANTSFSKFRKEIEKRVIGQAQLALFLTTVYNYLECLVENRPINHNILLAAPSGSGKTETYRALRDYFNAHLPELPIVFMDTSQITATGFRGVNATDLLDVYSKKGMSNAIGLCFLDEFDKKLMPSYTSSGSNINLEVQNTLLTLIEGGDIAIPPSNFKVNTSKIMFIGMGSFAHFRKKRDEKTTAIGFGVQEESADDALYKYITRENMLEAGGTAELIGRFPYVFNYAQLSKKAVDRIIKKKLDELCIGFNIFEIQVSGKMKKYLYDMANSKFGCRGIDSVLRNLVLTEYSKTLEEEIKECLIMHIEDEHTITHTQKLHQGVMPEIAN